MRNHVVFVGLVGLLVVGYVLFYVVSPEANAPTVPLSEMLLQSPESKARMERRVAPEYGIQFEYRSHPDGYILTERARSEGEDPSLVQTFTLMLERDYRELLSSPEAREGPPTITVHIFRNDKRQLARVWAEHYQQYSNIQLAVGDIADTTFAGANAIRYKADGLYVHDVIVVPHGGFMYVVTGAYLDEGSTIRTDFSIFLNSIRFVPIEVSE